MFFFLSLVMYLLVWHLYSFQFNCSDAEQDKTVVYWLLINSDVDKQEFIVGLDIRPW